MTRSLEILAVMQQYGVSFLQDLASWLSSSPVAFVFVILWLVAFVFTLLRVVMTWK